MNLRINESTSADILPRTDSTPHCSECAADRSGVEPRLASAAHGLARGLAPVARGGGRLLRGLIRAYQLCLSPYLSQRCRFYPSCSRYALDAVERFGAVRGSYLALRRLMKCHPFHPGGVDLVPSPMPRTPTRGPIHDEPTGVKKESAL